MIFFVYLFYLIAYCHPAMMFIQHASQDILTEYLWAHLGWMVMLQVVIWYVWFGYKTSSPLYHDPNVKYLQVIIHAISNASLNVIYHNRFCVYSSRLVWFGVGASVMDLLALLDSTLWA